MEPSPSPTVAPERRRSPERPGEEYAARLGSLSRRERAVVDLAAQGLTDSQISQELGLSLATVNSYWTRIRTKLGSLSRVEIVIELLAHQSLERNAALQEENERLAAELEARTEELRELRSVDAGLQEGAWSLLALLHSPEPTLVTRPPANVVFANRRARHLLRAEASELDGLPMHRLTAAPTPEALREPCRPLFEADGPERETVGVEEPFFVRRCDGTNFRAILHAERFDSDKGPFAVVTLKEYLGDVEPVLRALCRPLGVN